MRGIELTADDLLRRAIIQCADVPLRTVSRSRSRSRILISFETYFARELEDLKNKADDGLLTLGDRWLSVTPKGRLLIRNICMVFDHYLRAGEDRARYSKLI